MTLPGLGSFGYVANSGRVLPILHGGLLCEIETSHLKEAPHARPARSGVFACKQKKAGALAPAVSTKRSKACPLKSVPD